jgi:hypothetical protein
MKLKRAARGAFQRVYGSHPGRAAEIEWLSVDVQQDGKREIVSLSLRGEVLTWSCTCNQQECAHGRAALAFLCDAEPEPAERLSDAFEPHSPPPPAGDRRTLAHTDQAAGADTAALAEALQDLLLAVVRAGVGEGVSAAVEEALQRLQRAAPDPMPLGVSRFIGRLKRALGARDADDAARLLAGASLLIDALKSGAGQPEARKRVLSWLGSLSSETEGVARMTDRTLIEVAREELPGLERAGLERRYLVDLSDGAVYREERPVLAKAGSIGPCPRAITVWLATVEQGAAPQRIRLLQYAVTPWIDADNWQRLAARALRDFEALRGGYRDALRAYPGLCEPFVLVAPKSVVHDAAPALIDDAGRHLPLHHPDNPAALRYLESVTAGATPQWIAGRLLDVGGTLALAPLGASVMRDGKHVYAQM